MQSITFGELIQKQRQKVGITETELAKKLEIPLSTLQDIEMGKEYPSKRLLPQIAELIEFDTKLLSIKMISEQLYYQLKGYEYADEVLEIVERRLLTERSGTLKDINRTEIIRLIVNYVSSQPIEKVWIFGSFAREEESFDSDIDLLVQFDKSANITLFDLIEIKQHLETITGRQIDLVQKGQELPSIKKNIEKEQILVYDQKAQRQGKN